MPDPDPASPVYINGWRSPDETQVKVRKKTKLTSECGLSSVYESE